MTKAEDYSYLIKTINYLSEKHKISFFITSSDFDVLYSWWIKRIPENILYESIDIVINRWYKKNKTIDGFKRFSYEVRKNFNNFLELKVSPNYNTAENEEKKTDDLVSDFINSIPELLNPIKESLVLLHNEKIRERKQEYLDEISHILLDLHSKDEELEFKTNKFLMNLNKQIRTKEMADRYKINYIFSKYKFPEVLLFFPDTDDIG